MSCMYFICTSYNMMSISCMESFNSEDKEDEKSSDLKKESSLDSDKIKDEPTEKVEPTTDDGVAKKADDPEMNKKEDEVKKGETHQNIHCAAQNQVYYLPFREMLS